MHRSLRIVIIMAVVFVGSILSGSRPVLADPHAVFYTAIGQRQLFFNLLAALDQADYVEPATGDNSRSQLEANREKAGLPPETDERVTSTETKLSSILTRGITLEGNDIWTAYLANQFAIEAARRTYTDEVIRVFCEALQRPGCSSTERSSFTNEKFINDITEYASQVTDAGKSALSSSNDPNSQDQKLRQKYADKSNPQPNRTVPFDSFVADARETAAKDPAVAKSFENIANHVTYASNDKVDTYALSDINSSATGYASKKNIETVEDITDAIGSLIQLPSSLQLAALNGAGKAELAQKAAQNSVVATRQNNVSSEKQNGVTVFKGVTETITVPKEGNEAQINALANVIANQDQNLKYAPATAESVPGRTELVNRPKIGTAVPAAAPVALAPSERKVAGILDSVGSALLNSVGLAGRGTGSTAGTFSGSLTTVLNALYSTYLKATDVELSADTNPIAPHREAGSVDALKALTDDIYLKDVNSGSSTTSNCGFCVPLSLVDKLVIEATSFMCSVFKIGCPL